MSALSVSQQFRNPDWNSLVFCPRFMAQVCLPRSKPKPGPVVLRNGNFEVVIQPEMIRSDYGEWIKGTVPWGTLPRLIMMYISSEISRTRANRISFGYSIRDFLLTIGYSDSSRNYCALQEQIRLLFSCSWTVVWQGFNLLGNNHGYGLTGLVKIPAIPRSVVSKWDLSNPRKRSFEIILSKEFQDLAGISPLPLESSVVAKIYRSPLCLDIYAILRYLCYSARGSRVIRICSLRDQLNNNFKNDKDFRKRFKSAVKEVLDAGAALPVDILDGRIQIHPSQGTRYDRYIQDTPF